jgi:hypothetical protein
VSDKILCSGWHWSFGWLRRPELDDNGGFAYEDGDGDLVFSHNAWHRHAAYLACLQDKETKEKYLTFSHVPKSYVKLNSRK